MSLASALTKYPHLAAFDTLIGNRMAAVEVEALLVYLVDLVNEDALYFLAEQFDVLGNKGWNAATTVTERRALIKRAIELHRYKGTAWAIKEALRTIGFDTVTVTERIMPFAKYHDGSWVHDGEWNHGAGHWAYFSVTIDNNGVPVSPTVKELIDVLILENKNVRSKLVETRYI